MNDELFKLSRHRLTKLGLSNISSTLSGAQTRDRNKEIIDKLKSQGFAFNKDDDTGFGEIEEESPSDTGIFRIVRDYYKVREKHYIFQKTIPQREISTYANSKSNIDLNEIEEVLNQNFEPVNINLLNNLGGSMKLKAYNRVSYSKSNMIGGSTIISNTKTQNKAATMKKKAGTTGLSGTIGGDSKKVSVRVNEGEETINNEFQQIIKTDNSYFRKDLASYHKENYDLNLLTLKYKENSHKYECIIIKTLCEEYEYKLSQGTNNEKFTEFYEILMQDKEKLLGKNYEKMEKTLKDFKSYASYCSYYLDMKVKAKKVVKRFVNGLMKQIKQDNEESTAENNYIKWKNKISELLNTWDLFEANGIEMKISVKYIPFRKMLISRAKRIRYNKELKLDDEGGKNLLGQFLVLGKDINKKDISNLPTSLFLKDDTIRILVDIGISILLLYTFFTFPMRIAFGDSPFYNFFEKFVDMLFYIDIVTNLRTAYIDKSNNEIYDIKLIVIAYLKAYFLIDFITSVSWKMFFIWNETIYSVLKFTVVLRILRIVKITPLLNRLEQLQSANYVRMFKLLLFYFIVLHWMAVILFLFVEDSIAWDDKNPACYQSNNNKTKEDMSYSCAYITTFNLAAYIVPGEYISDFNIIEVLNPSNEYIVFILEYLIGSVLSAYIFGGMASIIQNLNQGQNFFTEKTDLLREHMLFYDIPESIQMDIQTYYDYLWQRHKDIIYGKHHFNLLSRSLREKFERMNLPGNEIYLKLFYSLGNLKIIDEILLGLKKYIAFPKEVVFAEGSLIYGLYIILNGEVVLISENNPNLKKITFSVKFADVLKEMDEKRKELDQSIQLNNDNDNINKNSLKETLSVELIERSVIFPLIPAFLKTGRTYQKCFCIDFTDLLYLPTEYFDNIINIFPIEMHMLKSKLVKLVEEQKLFENEKLFKTISNHSARSVGSYYEKSYDKYSIWIPIPIPISQRKIAKNYIPFFLNKVNFLHKEIILSSDLDICFNSSKIFNMIRNNVKEKNVKKSDKKENNNNNNNSTNDVVEHIRGLGKQVNALANELTAYNDKFKLFMENK